MLVEYKKWGAPDQTGPMRRPRYAENPRGKRQAKWLARTCGLPGEIRNGSRAPCWKETSKSESEEEGNHASKSTRLKETSPSNYGKRKGGDLGGEGPRRE